MKRFKKLMAILMATALIMSIAAISASAANVAESPPSMRTLAPPLTSKADIRKALASPSPVSIATS